MIECAFALLVAFVINVSIIKVSGSVCSSSKLNADDVKSCQDLDLNKASFLLRNVLGSWSSKLFAIALLASEKSKMTVSSELQATTPTPSVNGAYSQSERTHKDQYILHTAEDQDISLPNSLAGTVYDYVIL
ncbi:hypothetical protein POM88_040374 [Heracleum sosnowskyi]|uniref:Uncharacterized protein n=1 Tax=Heracleum sosnowskyi TaxID=360622 RepID=A0AAD8HER9_9APIA|nr:hypothetical protein POM88_040374 [Heracleum sosnowskyi]